MQREGATGADRATAGGPVQGGPGVTLLGRLEMNNFPRPSVARTLSPNGRAHYMARYRAVQAVQMRVALDARMQGLPQMCDGLVVVRPIWTFPITRKHDSDNLSTGVLKACLDALVRGRWLLDDSSEHVRLEPPVIRVERGRRMLVLEFETSEVPTDRQMASAPESSVSAAQVGSMSRSRGRQR